MLKFKYAITMSPYVVNDEDEKLFFLNRKSQAWIVVRLFPYNPKNSWIRTTHEVKSKRTNSTHDK